MSETLNPALGIEILDPAIQDFRPESLAHPDFHDVWKGDGPRLLRVKKLNPQALLPTQAEGSAGYDLYGVEDVTVPVKGSVVVDTGIAMEFPDGLVGLILDRSGLGVKGIMRRAGVVDANYRGEWKVILFNSGDTPIFIERLKACAQVVFVPKIRFGKIVEVTELSSTERGEKGFGSTDVPR